MSPDVAVPGSRVFVDLGRGPERLPVSAWQVTRSLSGGGLPGQARAVSGSSVPSGSLTLLDTYGATPWNGGTVAPGGLASIDATPDAEGAMGYGPTAWEPVARMAVRGVGAGSWLSGARDVELEGAVPRGMVSVPSTLEAGTLDACAVVDAAARAGGYYATRPPTPTTIASWPLVGSLWSEVRGGFPMTSIISDGARYATVEGRAMLIDSAVTGSLFESAESETARFGYAIDFDLYAPAPATDTLALIVHGPAADLLHVTLDSLGRLRAETTTSSATWTIAAGRLYRVSFLRTSTTWRLFLDGHYQGEVADSVASGAATVQVLIAGGAHVGGVQVSLADAPGGDWQPTARIAATGSPLDAVIGGVSGRAWDVIQDVANSTLGAAWLDEEGHLIFRARDDMRAPKAVGDIEALSTLEDIPWRLSTDEVADRVEVSYSPPTISYSLHAELTVWESTDTVVINGGSTAILERDIEGAASLLAWWDRVEDVSVRPVTQGSRYAAWTAPPGQPGSAPPASALAITSELVTASRIRIRIHNTTGSRLWVYSMTARAHTAAYGGAAQTIAAGMPAESANTPLSVNLGAWVQSDIAAQEILAWLVNQSSTPRPTLTGVQLVPDLSRRLGEAYWLNIRPIAGQPHVRFKVMVTRLDTAATPDGLTQSADLTVLEPTFADFNEAWGAGATLNDFNAVWSGATFDDFNRDPLRTA